MQLSYLARRHSIDTLSPGILAHFGDKPGAFIPKTEYRNRRGSALLEFAVVAILFLSTVFLSFNFFFWVYAKAALHNAVREGVRYAITGRTKPSIGQDASIKSVVADNAFGLLSSPSDAAKITIDYYAADGSGTASDNSAGNIVVISVRDYTPPTIAPVFGFSLPIRINVRAIDKLEPFPGMPAQRVLP
jgi:Flp pilus assembly protein TadG